MSHNRVDCQRSTRTMVARASPMPDSKKAIPKNLMGASHACVELMVFRSSRSPLFSSAVFRSLAMELFQ